MPIKSKFPGYDLIGEDEPFKVGDYYYPYPYKELPANDFNIKRWGIITRDNGPREPNQSFRDRHGVSSYTIIRKSSNQTGFPVRLALSKTFSTPLPLP